MKQLVRALGLVTFIVLVAASAEARPLMFVDAPRPGATVDSWFHIGGWALDTDARTSSGIAVVHIWAYPVSGANPVFLGFAVMDGQRPDVAAAFGAQYVRSGFGMNTHALPPGGYTVVVFPFSSVTNGFAYDAVLTIPVTVRSGASAPVQAPGPDPAPAGAGVVRYLDWNIHHGVGTDGACNLDRIAQWIAKSGANVVSLNEVERQSGWCGNADEPAELEARLESRTGRTWHSHFAQRDGQATGQGNLILTTFAIEDRDAYRLSYSRSVARAQITVNGVAVNIFSTHLAEDSSSYRSAQMAELKRWAATFAEQRLIAGDFNAWPGAGEIGTMRVGYVDSWAKALAAGTATAYTGNTAGNTRNSRIDYVWMSDGASRLALVGSRVFDVRDANGVQPSDHRPVMSTFEVR